MMIRILKRTVIKVMVSCIMSSQYYSPIQCSAYYVIFAVFRIKINADSRFSRELSLTMQQYSREGQQ